MSDLGRSDARSNINSLVTNRFNGSSFSNYSSYSSNFIRNRGMRGDMNEDLSYWERGETSGVKNGEETLSIF